MACGVGFTDDQLPGEQLEALAGLKGAVFDQTVVLDPTPAARAYSDAVAHGRRSATGMCAVGEASGVTWSPVLRLWIER